MDYRVGFVLIFMIIFLLMSLINSIPFFTPTEKFIGYVTCIMLMFYFVKFSIS